jgi:trehalose 6-phosphate synthase/phosphatase
MGSSSRLVIVSNRLSASVAKEKGGLSFKSSVGGLATGLSSVSQKQDMLWIGWSGMVSEELNVVDAWRVRRRLRSDYQSVSVKLKRQDLHDYYNGFCNNVIWPLFHYFPTYAHYDSHFWEAYQRVNRLFFEAVAHASTEHDVIWVHDYHLLLLPGMLRSRFRRARIGFFLHIPFPSYELFRLLPWRNEILEGLLGADLIGFHTYGYARHFFSSVRHLLGREHNLGLIRWDGRIVKADVFPMGIDYAKYASAGRQQEVRAEREKIAKLGEGRRLILSVDRLDYTKGINQRLRAFALFLERNPEYRGQVSLILVIAPSRTKVSKYMELKRELDERVSLINGTYATMEWLPVRYFFRSFGFPSLTALYLSSEILLVTPLRDGMNLIAKEYLATRQDMQGVLVLSETAGAAEELGEALIVNPNKVEEIADALKRALEMPPGEREERNRHMLRRLERYDVHFWVDDFLGKLSALDSLQEEYSLKRLSGSRHSRLVADYRAARSRLVLLDYDGSLVRFADRPESAAPDEEIRALLGSLAAAEGNEVVLISGRDKAIMERWFGELGISIVSDHGVWFKEKGSDWHMREQLKVDWKQSIRPILERQSDRTPGAILEEKEYSLAWHYRLADPELAALRLTELREALMELTANLDLSVLEGDKVLEVKNTIVNKGRAASVWLAGRSWDFILAVGDDRTDEDMFAILPDTAYSIKVGSGISKAKYSVNSVDEVRALLKVLAGK